MWTKEYRVSQAVSGPPSELVTSLIASTMDLTEVTEEGRRFWLSVWGDTVLLYDLVATTAIMTDHNASTVRDLRDGCWYTAHFLLNFLFMPSRT